MKPWLTMAGAMLGTLVAGVPGRAQAPAGLPPPVPQISAPAPAPAPVAARSSAGKRRDPFWPVNYRPRTEQPVRPPPVEGQPDTPETVQPAPPAGVASAGVDWQAARRQLSVGGLVRYRPKGADADVYSAMINGRLVEPGDVVQVDYQGIRYRWRVRAIGPQGVSLTNVLDGEAARPK